VDLLTLQDGKIVRQDGQTVALRGVNIGGWLNMEHFLTGHPGSESSLRRTMAAALGRDKAAFFFERLQHHFFNEQDVAFLKAVGLSAIRLPVNYRHLESDLAPFEYLETGFARLDETLAWCEKHGLYVILDLHSVQGWQNGDWHSDNSTRHALFWFQRQAQDRFVALWQEIARRYRGRGVIAAFNLMNEPLTNAPYGRFDADEAYVPDWDIMNSVYRRTIGAIRAAGSAHIIVIEGDYYSTRFDGLDAPYDANVMVSNHNYIEAAIAPIDAHPPTINGTTWDAAYIHRQFVETEGWRYAQAHDVPLLVGEFGLSMDYPGEQVPYKVAVLADQLGVYNALGCHWTFWAYKALGSMGWIQTASDSAYVRTIQPVLEAKQALGVDFGWLGGFSDTIQPHMQAISRAIGTHLPGLDPAVNFRYLSQAAMSTYTADQLQRLYAAQFAAKSETEIDQILASFALDQCVERAEMTGVIRQAARDFSRYNA
jgi:aryl-phospho-beta-D-glucosidase BglC (GH1 family)